MATNTLKAHTGRSQGTRPSRRLRRTGLVPAVVYGLGAEPVAVSVDKADLRVALSTDAGINALIQLDIDGASQLSIIKDLQRHPVRRDVLHVDFLRIDPDAEVEVDVPLVLVGEAKQVTQASGMVDQVMHSVAVLAKPSDIPAEVTADVSDLEVGSSLRVSDIEFPDGVAASGDTDATFAVGVITRSTREYMREQRDLEADAELLALGGDEEASDDASAGDDES